MRLPAISTLGTGLNRPECVLTHSSGLVFVPNCSGNGGISIINSQGECSHLFNTHSQKPIKPNGIALEANGDFLLAHLGANSGGVFRLKPNGKLQSVVTHADGHPLPPTNFVVLDEQERIWITVSTTKSPRALDYRASANSGFIALAQPGDANAKIVANNLGYTNECVVDMDQSAVYVNETFARRLTRFDLSDDGSLNNEATITHFGAGSYPDGLTLDEQGNFWITSIVSNRVIKVTPSGKQTLILEDSDIKYVDDAEIAYIENQLNAKHLGSTGNTTLKNVSSLAFGGANGQTAYMGNLSGSCLHTFISDVRGRQPQHWNAQLNELLPLLD